MVCLPDLFPVTFQSVQFTPPPLPAHSDLAYVGLGGLPGEARRCPGAGALGGLLSAEHTGWEA